MSAQVASFGWLLSGLDIVASEGGVVFVWLWVGDLDVVDIVDDVDVVDVCNVLHAGLGGGALGV